MRQISVLFALCAMLLSTSIGKSDLDNIDALQPLPQAWIEGLFEKAALYVDTSDNPIISTSAVFHQKVGQPKELQSMYISTVSDDGVRYTLTYQSITSNLFTVICNLDRDSTFVVLYMEYPTGIFRSGHGSSGLVNTAESNFREEQSRDEWQHMVNEMLRTLAGYVKYSPR